MNVLIVGFGSIAKKHLDALKHIVPQCRVYALRRSEHKEEQDVTNLYSFDELKNYRFDFAIISNPTLYHSNSLMELKSFNIPLFIEKPVFSKVDPLNSQLVKDLNQNNIPTYVACNLRFLDGLIRMKDILKDKRIEEVNVYCGSYLPDWRENKDYKNIYSAKKDEGGGVELDLIHELDYIFWIFGEPKKHSHIFKSSSSLDIESNDYANYILEYNRFCANVVLNYYRRDPKRTFEVLTTDGTYLLDLLQHKIYFNNTLIFESDQTIKDTYELQMRFFIENKINKQSDFNSIAEAYKVLKICLGKN